MPENSQILNLIELFCQEKEIAESTFGLRAVNDGKFVGRLRAGKGITLSTLKTIEKFFIDNKFEIDKSLTQPQTTLDSAKSGHSATNNTEPHFRFYDNRQKYLLFVNTCSEKWAVANRVGQELSRLKIRSPALRVFDAGVGDGTVLSRVMRHMHKLHPNVPFYVVGKEISLEDVRLTLEKLPDRFNEHPASVVIITNMLYSEAPQLFPRDKENQSQLNWGEVDLEGNSAHEFEEQISNLDDHITYGWQVRTSQKTGNPVYVRPSVLVLYRKDHSLLMDNIIPRVGSVMTDYNLVIASQPFRLRASLDLKIKKILAPLVRSLAPGGRLVAIQSHGGDPGAEIINRVWADERPFIHNRQILLEGLRKEIGFGSAGFNFGAGSDRNSLFRYVMHTLPSEIGASIGTSTLMAAWNAAVYVAQIEDKRLEMIMSSNDYLEHTAASLRKHNGLWFNDESFVVSRRGRP